MPSLISLDSSIQSPSKHMVRTDKRAALRYALSLIDVERWLMVLTDAMVTKIGMGVGVPIVLIFLFFIIWDLAKESKAGRFGTLMMFLVLGGGFISYIIKEVIVFFMERNL